MQCSIIASAITLAALSVESIAHAHADDSYQHAYFEFLSGFEATLSKISVLLLLAVTALLLGLWRIGISLQVWLLVMIGMFAGGIVGTLGWIPPILTAYGAVILAGLLVAVSPRIGDHVVGMIVAALVLVMTNAMLNGYDWRQIPPPAYLGVATAIFLGLAVGYSIIQITLRLLPFGWVLIAWRAVASWVVAIAVLMIALLVTNTE